ncbi:hypothetical protein [Halobacillus salinus]|uniref:hypothetical protein n=1 Tax=Halobacillus salinus TaxID=192814 RepID=UPI001590185F|nr:hypothetical protein [Halobacillus salinus]
MFRIRSAYFAFGLVKLNHSNGKKMTKAQTCLYLLGGIISNLLIAILLDILTGYEFFTFRNYMDSFIFLSYLQVIINLIPLTATHGESDGKKVLQELQS